MNKTWTHLLRLSSSSWILVQKHRLSLILLLIIFMCVLISAVLFYVFFSCG